MLSFLLLLAIPFAIGQNSPNCETVSDDDFLTGRTFFNYGSATNAFNTRNRVNITIGQPVVGNYFGQLNKGTYGFWASFLLPPAAPTVMASEGDLEDRVQIDWNPDPLSPAATSYKIYRNGSLLASVDGETFSFLDFNVIAGRFYTYEVSGVNSFGEGKRGSSLGFLNPNGVVTGQIKSVSQNPVPGAIVTLNPTLGAALAFSGDDMAFAEYDSSLPTDKFTISCWVKLGENNDNAAIFDLGSFLGKNWWLHTLPATDGKGIRFGVGKAMGDVTELDYVFPMETANNWHYIAATYNGSSLLLYVDGELIDTQIAEIEATESVLYLGRKAAQEGFYTGQLDEFRIFNRQLSQTELQMFMNRTISANAEGLVGYWKFDEGVGSKAFDQSDNNIKIYFCGASWTNDKANVVNAGVTDETGFYEISGINYGAGQTFTAVPSKNFYFNQSLEFNAANNSYANLTDFDLADSATLTLFVKAFDFSGNQTLLSKADAGGNNLLSIDLINGNITLALGNETHDFGALDMGFHHLAFLLEQAAGSNSVTVNFYKDGVSAGTTTLTNNTRDFATGSVWKLGAKADGMGHTNYFSGLIDEVAFFESLLTLPEIQAYANVGTDITNVSLVNYFNLNEGLDTALHDMGTGLSGNGSTVGATWSTSAANEEVLGHDFSPSSKLVTLNPSATSVDQVDFTDQSTIPVSGYVRFDKTVCFQKKVEILVNGQSSVPQIFTDENGYFSADFEPGKNIVLTPKFENHSFYPAFWEINNLNAPVAGILFRNQTTREVSGQLAGGLCRKSIIPDGSIVKVKLTTLNGCYEEELTLENPNGRFLFKGVPADSVTVAVTQHSNSIIYEYFQLQGGATLDLRMKNDTIDFIYTAPPNVELTALPTNECGDPMLEQVVSYTTTIKVFEQYDGGKCYLDTALLKINNEIADLSQFDTLMTEGELKYSFKAGEPNIVTPFLKTLQVTAEANDEQSSEILQAVVLGRRPRETTFASTSPEIPIMILRDPPGDASSAFIEKGQTTCQSWSYSAVYGGGVDAGVTLHLGPDLETSLGLGAEVTFEVDVTADIGISTSTSYSNLTTNEAETCVTVTEVISTSDSDEIIGNDGGDVFMGGAINYIFGITDELLYDTMSCNFFLDKGLYVYPDGFNTTFIYTEHNIKNVVIPNLLAIGDTVSANRWQETLELNNRLKAQAIFSRNISMDAGIVYEQSETTENTKAITHEWSVDFSTSFTQAYGFTANGVGLSGGIDLTFSTTQSESATISQTNARTVGFTLADDDIGDNFSITIKKDPAYGTPVFDLVSGRSSCPNEPNTLPRDGVNITADKTVAINIPMNDAAVFTLTLGNTSPTEEARTYILASDQISNPDGAIIRFNGEPTLAVELEPNKGQDVTMTIEKGPVAFEYDDLTISFGSDCDGNFSETLVFDVQFLEPCSPVDIGFPLQDWVLIPDDGNIFNITVNSYNKSDADLELVRVQYRRSQGDGAWINIRELQKAELGEVFTIVGWDTQGLEDGLYEIRAITQCFSGALNPGISEVIKGKIERTAPAILGVPQPADGVLGPGDEISITFTEPIRCEDIVQADIFDNNNIGLYNTRTGELIDAIISCSNDKIVVVPKVANSFIENEVLRVEVDNIKDLVGNTFVGTSWEFLVDRNPIAWETNRINDFKYDDERKTLFSKLINRGGTNEAFNITGIPAWVEVFPREGVLSPGQEQVVTFVFDRDMILGNFAAELVMEGSLGDEPFLLNFDNFCRPPMWNVNPADWTYSMNFTVELDIKGDLSEDKFDIVGAFIDDELRGMAYVEYIESVDAYQAFLTVYSNDFSGGTVEFQIWDASACLLYGQILESFPYEADQVVGVPLEPQVLTTSGLLLRAIPLAPGWNWISFNLAFPDNSLNEALSSLQHPQNDLIKSQTAFASYNDAPLNSWIGSLTAVNNTAMFQFQAERVDTIRMVGNPIDLSSTTIPVVAGWNWIGYLPLEALPVDEALASLTPLNNDVIKSQTAFAQYVAGFGWIGNLKFMSAPNGYLLNISNAGTLQFPANVNTPLIESRNENEAVNSPWSVEPNNFEHNMILVGILSASEMNITKAEHVLGAFVGEEARGVTKAVYVEQLNAWMFFMTIFANRSGEQLTFGLYDESTNEKIDLMEQFYFSIDGRVGEVMAPIAFNLSTVAAHQHDAKQSEIFVQPNPFNEITRIAFPSEPANTEIIITDALGNLILSEKVIAKHNWTTYDWNATGLPSGVYFIKVSSGKQIITKKVIKQR